MQSDLPLEKAMPDFGFVIEHDPQDFSPLETVAGRAVIGHVIDQLCRVDENAPVLINSKAPGDALIEWARWSRVEIVQGASQSLAEDRGWKRLVRVASNVAVLPHREIFAALCMADAGVAKIRVGVRFDLPLGAFAEVQATAGGNAKRDLIVYGATSDPDIQFLIGDAAAAARLESTINRAGRMPADLRLGDGATPEASPWRGSAGPLMIAEIGGNHEGDFETALRMTEQAIRSGADCVKFQLYKGETLVSPVESPDRNRHFKKFELTKEQHVALAERCRDAGCIYLASVWDADMLEWIDPYLDFYKVGSGDLTAWPFVGKMAERGKPMLLSTGLATLDEVVQTVEFIRSVNPRYKRREMLCVMQCTSMYPIPDKDANLRVLEALETLGVATGYSDHTIGDRALVAATAMGADVLEFHFTDRREGQTFRDHKVSLLEAEVRTLKDELRRVSAFRGAFTKRRQQSETAVGHEVSFRRGIYTKVDVEVGEVLLPNLLTWLRPAHGTDARNFERVAGATAKRKIKAFAAVNEGEDYDPHI